MSELDAGKAHVGPYSRAKLMAKNNWFQSDL